MPQNPVPRIGEEVSEDWFAVPPVGSDVSPYFASTGAPATVSDEDFMPPGPQGSSVGRFVGNALEALNPITAIEGVAKAIRHPIDTVSGIAEQQYGEAKKAYELAKDGRFSEAIGHAGAPLPSTARTRLRLPCNRRGNT